MPPPYRLDLLPGDGRAAPREIILFYPFNNVYIYTGVYISGRRQRGFVLPIVVLNLACRDQWPISTFTVYSKNFITVSFCFNNKSWKCQRSAACDFLIWKYHEGCTGTIFVPGWSPEYTEQAWHFMRHGNAAIQYGLN